MPYLIGSPAGKRTFTQVGGGACVGRCPRCGEGHMFDGFLALQNSCDNCGLDL